MNNLLKMEKYQLSHNIFYWCGLIGIFLIGFFTADTYVPEAMGPMGGAATSLADIFNGMVYDSTFLLIIISSILALILGQEFSSRTIDLEVNAGHSRKTIFFAKVISYLIAFNIMALVYPVAGCIRESVRFGITEAGNLSIMNYLSSGNVGLLSMASGGSLYLKALLIAIITLILMGSLSGLMMQKKDI